MGLAFGCLGICHLTGEMNHVVVPTPPGLAPFRGFIQERSVGKRENKALGNTVLYFGCRHKSEDYIYQDELEAFNKEGTISDLLVAFSRDQVCVLLDFVLCTNALKLDIVYTRA